MRSVSVSRYRNAPIIVQGQDTYFGPRPTYDASPRSDDRYYDVLPGDNFQRIAYRMLGDSRLWWVVADFNDIMDPFVELEPGSTVRVPSASRLWMEVLR